MKNLILILLVILSVNCSSQENTVLNHNNLPSYNHPEPSYLELRREYKEYCNQNKIEECHRTKIQTFNSKLDALGKVFDLFIYYGFQYDTIVFNQTCTEIIENISKIDTTYTVYETVYIKKVESQEGFWEWVNKNYLK